MMAAGRKGRFFSLRGLRTEHPFRERRKMRSHPSRRMPRPGRAACRDGKNGRRVCAAQPVPGPLPAQTVRRGRSLSVRKRRTENAEVSPLSRACGQRVSRRESRPSGAAYSPPSRERAALLASSSEICCSSSAAWVCISDKSIAHLL